MATQSPASDVGGYAVFVRSSDGVLGLKGRPEIATLLQPAPGGQTLVTSNIPASVAAPYRLPHLAFSPSRPPIDSLTRPTAELSPVVP